MLSSQRERDVVEAELNLGSDDRSEFELNSEDWPPTPPRKPRTFTSAFDSDPSQSERDPKAAAGTGLAAQSATMTNRTVNQAFLDTLYPDNSRIKAGKLVTVPSSQAPKAPQPQPSYSAAKASLAPPPKIHPIFHQKVNKPSPNLNLPVASVHTSSYSYTSVKSSLPNLNATFSRSNSSSEPASLSSGGSTISAIRKKRVNPWEVVTPDKSQKKNPPNEANTATGAKLSAPTFSRAGSTEPSKAELLTSSTLDIKQKVMLSTEQQQVLKTVVEKSESVFFTGSAGKWPS